MNARVQPRSVARIGLCPMLGILVFLQTATAAPGPQAGPAEDAASSALVRVERAQRTIAHLREEAETIEREIAALRGPGRREPKYLETLRRTLERLRAEIEALKDALVADGKSSDDRSLSELKQCLARLQEKLRRLNEEKTRRERALARAQDHAARKATDSRTGVGMLRGADKSPKRIALVGDRAIPIQEPYYDFEYRTVIRGIGRIRYVSKVTRVKDGEHVDKALKDGGCVDRILDGSDPDSSYIKLWVSPDAIPAFRRVSQEVKRRGFDFFWVKYEADSPIKGGTGKSNGGVVY